MIKFVKAIVMWLGYERQWRRARRSAEAARARVFGLEIENCISRQERDKNRQELKRLRSMGL